MITHLMILNHISSWYLNTKSSNLVLLLSWAREEEKKKAFYMAVCIITRGGRENPRSIPAINLEWRERTRS